MPLVQKEKGFLEKLAECKDAYPGWKCFDFFAVALPAPSFVVEKQKETCCTDASEVSAFLTF